MTGKNEKVAMSNADRMKYVRATILAGLGAAGIGAFIRDKKAKKDRKKALEIASSKNAIVVPVSKKKFLEGIKTPDEQKKETSGWDGGSEQKNDQIGAGMDIDTGVTDLEQKKKDILRGRKFNFFGKRASEKENKQAGVEVSGKSEDEGKKDVVSEEKIDGRVVLRGQDGKFVSPAGPAAVMGVEKKAVFEDWHKLFTSPGKFLSDMKAGATGKPLAFSLGAVGSIILASKISDAINENRKDKAKGRVEEARAKYVKLLDRNDGETEKSAKANEDSLGYSSGALAGAAFFVPMALTALVTNKILENRKAEKKKEKELASSIPDDPIILYQTHDGEQMKIAADTALMAILIQKSMIEDAERVKRRMSKSAQFVPGGGIGAPPSSNRGPRQFSEGDVNKAVEYTVKHLTDEKNRARLLDIMKRYRAGEDMDYKSEIKDMLPRGFLGLGLKGAPDNFSDIAGTPEFRSALARHGGLRNTVLNNFENDPEWKKYKDEQIGNGISDYLESNWGLERGGVLHKIMAWLMKTFGYGNTDFNNAVRAGLDDMAFTPEDKKRAREAAEKEIAAQERAAAIEQVKRMKPGDKGYAEAYNNLLKNYPDATNEVEPPEQIGVGDQNQQPPQQPTQQPQPQQTPAQPPSQPQAQQPAQQQPTQPYNWPMFMKDYWPRSAQEALEGSFRGGPAGAQTSVAQPTPSPVAASPANNAAAAASSQPATSAGQETQGSAAVSQAQPTWEDFNDAIYNADRNAESAVTHRVNLPQRQKAPPGMRWIPNYGYITEQEYQNNLSGAPKTTTVGQASDFAPDFKNPDGSDDLDGMVNYLENGDDKQFAQGIPSQAKNTF